MWMYRAKKKKRNCFVVFDTYKHWISLNTSAEILKNYMGRGNNNVYIIENLRLIKKYGAAFLGFPVNFIFQK